MYIYNLSIKKKLTLFYSKFCTNKYGQPIDNIKIEKNNLHETDMNCCKFFSILIET